MLQPQATRSSSSGIVSNTSPPSSSPVCALIIREQQQVIANINDIDGSLVASQPLGGINFSNISPGSRSNLSKTITVDNRSDEDITIRLSFVHQQISSSSLNTVNHSTISNSSTNPSNTAVSSNVQTTSAVTFQTFDSSDQQFSNQMFNTLYNFQQIKIKKFESNNFVINFHPNKLPSLSDSFKSHDLKSFKGNIVLDVISLKYNDKIKIPFAVEFNQSKLKLDENEIEFGTSIINRKYIKEFTITNISEEDITFGISSKDNVIIRNTSHRSRSFSNPLIISEDRAIAELTFSEYETGKLLGKTENVIMAHSSLRVNVVFIPKIIGELNVNISISNDIDGVLSTINFKSIAYTTDASDAIPSKSRSILVLDEFGKQAISKIDFGDFFKGQTVFRVITLRNQSNESYDIYLTTSSSSSSSSSTSNNSLQTSSSTTTSSIGGNSPVGGQSQITPQENAKEHDFIHFEVFDPNIHNALLHNDENSSTQQNSGAFTTGGSSSLYRESIEEITLLPKSDRKVLVCAHVPLDENCLFDTLMSKIKTTILITTKSTSGSSNVMTTSSSSATSTIMSASGSSNVGMGGMMTPPSTSITSLVGVGSSGVGSNTGSTSTINPNTIPTTTIITSTTTTTPERRVLATLKAIAHTCTSIIEVSPTNIKFGDSTIGDIKFASVTVFNKSDLPTRISVQFTSKVITCKTKTALIAPHKSIRISFRLSPRRVNPNYRKQITIVNENNKLNEQIIEVESNNVDRNMLNFHCKFYDVHTSSQHNYAKSINFGVVALNGIALSKFQLSNISDEPIVLRLRSSLMENELVPYRISRKNSSIQQQQDMISSSANETASDNDNIQQTSPPSDVYSPYDSSSTTTSYHTTTGTGSGVDSASSPVFKHHKKRKRKQQITTQTTQTTTTAATTATTATKTSNVVSAAASPTSLQQQPIKPTPLLKLKEESFHMKRSTSLHESFRTGNHVTASTPTLFNTDFAGVDEISTLVSFDSDDSDEDNMDNFSTISGHSDMFMGNTAPISNPQEFCDDLLTLYEKIQENLFDQTNNQQVADEESIINDELTFKNKLSFAIEQYILVPCDLISIEPRSSMDIFVTYSPKSTNSKFMTTPSNISPLSLHSDVSFSSNTSINAMKKNFEKLFIELVEYDRTLVDEIIPKDSLPPRELTVQSKVCLSMMEIAQKNINFGSITNVEDRKKTITISNASEVPLLFRVKRSGSIASNDIKILDMLECGGVVRPYGSRDIQLYFKPSLPGVFNETLTFENILDESEKIHIVVKADIRNYEKFTLKSNDVNFGNILIGQPSISRKIVVTNMSKNRRIFETMIEYVSFSFCRFEFEYDLEPVSQSTEIEKLETELEKLEHKYRICVRKNKTSKIKKLTERINEIKKELNFDDNTPVGRVDDDVFISESDDEGKKERKFKKIEENGIRFAIPARMSQVINLKIKPYLIGATSPNVAFENGICRMLVYENRNTDEQKMVTLSSVVYYDIKSYTMMTSSLTKGSQESSTLMVTPVSPLLGKGHMIDMERPQWSGVNLASLPNKESTNTTAMTVGSTSSGSNGSNGSTTQLPTSRIVTLPTKIEKMTQSSKPTSSTNLLKSIQILSPEIDLGTISVGEKVKCKISITNESKTEESGFVILEGSKQSSDCELQFSKRNGTLPPGKYENIEVVCEWFSPGTQTRTVNIRDLRTKVIHKCTIKGNVIVDSPIHFENLSDDRILNFGFCYIMNNEASEEDRASHLTTSESSTILNTSLHNYAKVSSFKVHNTKDYALTLKLTSNSKKQIFIFKDESLSSSEPITLLKVNPHEIVPIFVAFKPYMNMNLANKGKCTSFASSIVLSVLNEEKQMYSQVIQIRAFIGKSILNVDTQFIDFGWSSNLKQFTGSFTISNGNQYLPLEYEIISSSPNELYVCHENLLKGVLSGNKTQEVQSPTQSPSKTCTHPHTLTIPFIFQPSSSGLHDNYFTIVNKSACYHHAESTATATTTTTTTIAGHHHAESTTIAVRAFVDDRKSLRNNLVADSSGVDALIFNTVYVVKERLPVIQEEPHAQQENSSASASEVDNNLGGDLTTSSSDELFISGVPLPHVQQLAKQLIEDYEYVDESEKDLIEEIQNSIILGIQEFQMSNISKQDMFLIPYSDVDMIVFVKKKKNNTSLRRSNNQGINNGSNNSLTSKDRLQVMLNSANHSFNQYSKRGKPFILPAGEQLTLVTMLTGLPLNMSILDIETLLKKSNVNVQRSLILADDKEHVLKLINVHIQLGISDVTLRSNSINLGKVGYVDQWNPRKFQIVLNNHSEVIAKVRLVSKPNEIEFLSNVFSNDLRNENNPTTSASNNNHANNSNNNHANNNNIGYNMTGSSGDQKVNKMEWTIPPKGQKTILATLKTNEYMDKKPLDPDGLISLPVVFENLFNPSNVLTAQITANITQRVWEIFGLQSNNTIKMPLLQCPEIMKTNSNTSSVSDLTLTITNNSPSKIDSKFRVVYNNPSIYHFLKIDLLDFSTSIPIKEYKFEKKSTLYIRIRCRAKQNATIPHELYSLINTPDDLNIHPNDLKYMNIGKLIFESSNQPKESFDIYGAIIQYPTFSLSVDKLDFKLPSNYYFNVGSLLSDESKDVSTCWNMQDDSSPPIHNAQSNISEGIIESSKDHHGSERKRGHTSTTGSSNTFTLPKVLQESFTIKNIKKYEALYFKIKKSWTNEEELEGVNITVFPEKGLLEPALSTVISVFIDYSSISNIEKVFEKLSMIGKSYHLVVSDEYAPLTTQNLSLNVKAMDYYKMYGTSTDSEKVVSDAHGMDPRGVTTTSHTSTTTDITAMLLGNIITSSSSNSSNSSSNRSNNSSNIGHTTVHSTSSSSSKQQQPSKSLNVPILILKGCRQLSSSGSNTTSNRYEIEFKHKRTLTKKTIESKITLENPSPQDVSYKIYTISGKINSSTSPFTISRTGGTIDAFDSHQITFTFNTDSIESFSDYIMIENCENPLDLKTLRASLEILSEIEDPEKLFDIRIDGIKSINTTSDLMDDSNNNSNNELPLKMDLGTAFIDTVIRHRFIDVVNLSNDTPLEFFFTSNHNPETTELHFSLSLTSLKPFYSLRVEPKSKTRVYLIYKVHKEIINDSVSSTPPTMISSSHDSNTAMTTNTNLMIESRSPSTPPQSIMMDQSLMTTCPSFHSMDDSHTTFMDEFDILVKCKLVKDYQRMIKVTATCVRPQMYLTRQEVTFVCNEQHSMTMMDVNYNPIDRYPITLKNLLSVPLLYIIRDDFCKLFKIHVVDNNSSQVVSFVHSSSNLSSNETLPPFFLPMTSSSSSSTTNTTLNTCTTTNHDLATQQTMDVLNHRIYSIPPENTHTIVIEPIVSKLSKMDAKYLEEHLFIYNYENIREKKLITIKFSRGSSITQFYSTPGSKSSPVYNALEESIVNVITQFRKYSEYYLSMKNLSEYEMDNRNNSSGSGGSTTSRSKRITLDVIEDILRQKEFTSLYYDIRFLTDELVFWGLKGNVVGKVIFDLANLLYISLFKYGSLFAQRDKTLRLSESNQSHKSSYHSFKQWIGQLSYYLSYFHGEEAFELRQLLEDLLSIPSE
ncbi:hypothetical protein C9374_001723 [Naegleria lovaniensis]|uniref:Uncharacterized protein n=1 Tax=Naegleria lovaniensis TaxID=51637 RepID=A0AA88GS49_NAELO|nr:uncharacterized protein C9374_001723 [Naegleria lovaniensis]KAG2387391.1 hypothetical protein C9374_001723 [Naegleria lovaniensis]